MRSMNTGRIFSSKMQMSISETMNNWMKNPSGRVCLEWRGEKRNKNQVGMEKNMVMAITAQAGFPLSQLMVISKQLLILDVKIN